MIFFTPENLDNRIRFKVNPGDEVMSDGYFSYYWISEIDKDDNTPSARIWKSSAMNAGPGLSPRYYGIPIRPVHE